MFFALHLHVFLELLIFGANSYKITVFGVQHVLDCVQLLLKEVCSVSAASAVWRRDVTACMSATVEVCPVCEPAGVGAADLLIGGRPPAKGAPTGKLPTVPGL